MARLRWQLPPRQHALRRTGAVALGIVAGSATGLAAALLGPEVAAALVLVPALLVATVARPLLGVAAWLVIAPLVETGPPAAFWIGHRLLPGVAVVAAVGWMLFERRRPQGRRLVILALAGVFVVLALANAALLAPQPRTALVQLVDNLLIPMALMAVVALAPPQGRRDWILVGAAAGLALGGQLVALAAGWLAPQWLPAAWAVKVAERGAGTLVDPAPFSAFVVVAAAAAGVAALRGGYLRAPLGVLLAGGAALAVALTLSRGSWLAGAVVVGVAVLAAPRRLLRPVVAIALAAVFLGLGPLGFLTDRLGARLVEERQVASRVAVLEEQLAAVAASPVLGHGYGAFQERRRADVEAGVRRVASHNTYLGLAVDFGVPLALLYLSPVPLLALRDRRLVVDRWARMTGVAALRARAGQAAAATPAANATAVTHGAAAAPRSTAAADGQRGVSTALVVLWLALVFQAIVGSFVDMGLGHPVGTGAWWLTIGLLVVTE